jgi:hypothetical protein
LRNVSPEWEDDSDDLGFDVDPELEEEWEKEWDEAESDAVELLRSALGDYRGQPPPDELGAAAATVRARLREGDHPLAWVRRAAGLSPRRAPKDDAQLLIDLAASTISPQEETGLDVEEEALLLSLEMADWLGAIVTAVRDGPGADASPDALVDGISRCPEVELEGDLDVDDESHINAAFWIIALPWEILGLTDRDRRLTEVGEWVLPRALARAWSGDFDREDEGGQG